MPPFFLSVSRARLMAAYAIGAPQGCDRESTTTAFVTACGLWVKWSMVAKAGASACDS